MLWKSRGLRELGHINRGRPQDKFGEDIQLVQCLMRFRIDFIKLHSSLMSNPMSGEVLA